MIEISIKTQFFKVIFLLFLEIQLNYKIPIFFYTFKNYFLNVTYFMIRAKLNDHQLSIKKKKEIEHLLK